MNHSLLRFFTGALLMACALGSLRAAEDTRVYELRIYTAHPGKISNVIARFRDHTVKLFEKHGMVNVGYFVPTEATDGAGEKLIYVLEHASRDAAKASWAAFNADPEWVAARNASEVDGKIVAKAESTFMSVTDFSPAVVSKASASPRVFEMRTYTTPEGKIAPLDARFRDHTMKLFEKHGMTNVAYWHPTDANRGAGKTLIYLLAYPNREAATAGWAAFRADPAWVAAKTASEKDGSLTTEVKSVFMTPTDFSRTK